MVLLVCLIVFINFPGFALLFIFQWFPFIFRWFFFSISLNVNWFSLVFHWLSWTAVGFPLVYRWQLEVAGATSIIWHDSWAQRLVVLYFLRFVCLHFQSFSRFCFEWNVFVFCFWFVFHWSLLVSNNFDVLQLSCMVFAVFVASKTYHVEHGVCTVVRLFVDSIWNLLGRARLQSIILHGNCNIFFTWIKLQGWVSLWSVW